MGDASQFDLKLRKQPQQARARKTYEKILSATAQLLDEVGLDGINTNLIAETAGVNISAIYKYFPNKYAILSVLAARLNDKQTDLTLEYLDSIDVQTRWQDIVRGMIDTMVEGTRKEKGLIALQSAMLGSPELKAIYRQSNEEVSKVFLQAFAKTGIKLPAGKKKLIGTCIGEIVPAMLDYSVSRGKRFDAKVIEELKRMHVGYISTYLDENYNA